MKRFPTIFGLILGSLLVVSTAEARLGENLAECEKRYGKGIPTKVKLIGISEAENSASAIPVSPLSQAEESEPPSDPQAQGLPPAEEEGQASLPSALNQEANTGEELEAAQLPKNLEETNTTSLFPSGTEKKVQIEVAEPSPIGKAFTTRGLNIGAIFEDDAAVVIRYQNRNIIEFGDDTSAPVELRPDEIDYLMTANSGGENWIRYNNPIVSQRSPLIALWRTSSQSRICGYCRQKKVLFFCKSTFWEKLMSEVRGHFGTATTSASQRLQGL